MGVDAQMVVMNPSPLSERDVRLLSVDLVEAFGTDALFVIPDWNEHFGEPRHALEIIDAYRQDGDTIHPREGWQMIEVHLWGRYYGPDYARGQWPLYDNIATWLYMRVPGCEVWYGGDSSGICAEHLTIEKRAELWAFFVANGRKPYTGFRSAYLSNKPQRRCSFCAWSGMVQSGFGQSYQRWYCAGCGLTEVTHDDGASWMRGTSADIDKQEEARRKQEQAK